MLHLFKDEGPWFRAKRFGYGAGWPCKWQGWVLLVTHLAIIVGLALLLGNQPVILLPVILLVAFAPMPIYAARTDGGWKWRKGDKN
ncbi:MAG: hypothetical protein IBJ12_08340 [Sphingomonadaceae bacterium]|nr:hypothetical protein [Sphingomonadaceae bacterium]